VRWLHEIECKHGAAIRQRAREMKQQTGAFTAFHIAQLAVEYDMPFKTMCEQFLESKVIPTGIYDLIARSPKIKIGQLMDEAKRRSDIHFD